MTQLQKETEGTCRKVGGFLKDLQGKDNRTPAQKEYDWAYNGPKQRKIGGRSAWTCGTLLWLRHGSCWNSLDGKS